MHQRSIAFVLKTVLCLFAGSVVMVACGGGSSGSGSSPATPTTPTRPDVPATPTISGVVTATKFTPGSSTDPLIASSYYEGATVCVDANANGVCDTGEVSASTNRLGRFTIALAEPAALIADIGTTATNTAAGTKVASRNVLRVGQAQVAEQVASGVVISALSSEILRMMEANDTSYAVEKQNLATRVGVAPGSVIADAAQLTGIERIALLAEAHVLDKRFTYAITKLDRGDLYPDALATPGGDPRLYGLTNVSSATAPTGPDTRRRITFAQAQQAAFNIEGIPRYEHVFVIMLENKASSSIWNSPFAPKINALLKAGNQLTNYYSTGNPSQPNYMALGGGDDFGVTDDAPWICDATGPNAIQDLPIPDNTQPGLRSSPFPAVCASRSAVSRNIVGKPNLFNALTAAGMSWRTYSASMNPGQDPRTDSVSDAAVVASDNLYPPGTLNGNRTTLGTAGLRLPMPYGLYQTKHHPGMAYQNVRSAPEWKYSNRTMGGGQWDAQLPRSTAYAIPPGYDYDQLGTDLERGQVGTLNFLVPDQCDDMHGLSFFGTVDGNANPVAPSDCGAVSNNVAANIGGTIITRGDNFVDTLVKKIQASPLWLNPHKRVAIILMFDEGSATAGFNSCCGWNVSNSLVANPLVQNADGSFARDGSVSNYTRGNRGHGQSIFGILTNQANAPKGVVDGDAYSHFSLVRTFQDMFGLADPAVDGSYMNRTKYTEHFIAVNILNLPEYASSADTHFDAVRPINHAWTAPAGYRQKQSADAALPAQVGPDPVQTNVWALK